MPDPAIENAALRYAASFAVVLATVLVGTATVLALSETVDPPQLALWAVMLFVAATGIEAMGRIERGESPFLDPLVDRLR